MPARIALVHHANQFVITDGYDDRDGISVTAAGYDAVLSLHVELDVPAALHISGPVLEAIAWHRPALLRRLRSHLASGLFDLVGGTYGENVIPLASPRHNRRQLSAFHGLAEELLEVPRERLQTAWVPERVWSTDTCAPPLRDAAATGVSYRRVLLDDRLSRPLADGNYPGSAREAFDATGPYRWFTESFPASGRGLLQHDALAPYRIAGGGGLVGVPIASHLRYLVPPHDLDHLRLLAEIAEDAAGAPDDTLLLFADDVERVAGVAGWEQGLERYARFLRWLIRTPALLPISLDAWSNQVEPRPEVTVEPGTYYELAHQHGAGEDYSRWADDERWRPYAERLDAVERDLDHAEDNGADTHLCHLAERLLMLGRHETAWQDPDPAGGRAPAPWVRATAAHAADAHAILAAARWVAHPRPVGLRVLVCDVDADGHDEVVLSSDRLFALLSPRYGGRMSLLVRREVGGHGTPRGTVVVGNPADHWNFQAELHRHMETPPNHPGALAVLGAENHAHEIGRIDVTPIAAIVELIDVEPGPDRGLTKQLILRQDGDALVVCLRRPGLPGELRTTIALAPDYLRGLRSGRDAVRRTEGSTWWGASTPGVDAWVAHDPAEQTGQLVDISPTTGHARVGAVDGCGRHLHLVLGTGPVDDRTGPALIAAAAPSLHRPAPASATRPAATIATAR